MADLILIKGGNGAVPTLQDRELGYSKDEKALYIGTPNGNVKLCQASDAGKDSVFYAIYEETPISEIAEAYNAGKIIACKAIYDATGYTTIAYLINTDTEQSIFVFATNGLKYTVTESGWDYSTT